MGGLQAEASNQVRLEQLITADTANKRIIDQLNGQVDFLNEQLAIREFQVTEMAVAQKNLKAVQDESEYRLVVTEQLRKDNQLLSSQLRFLENKVYITCCSHRFMK